MSGDAEFIDDTFEDCISTDFGGAFSFISNGVLVINNCKFERCISFGGKGGAIYVLGYTQHTINKCKFMSCVSSHTLLSEGGSIYIEGGEN